MVDGAPHAEFITAAADKDKVFSKQKVEACFSMFDKDQSGKISANELRTILCGVTRGEKEDQVWQQIIAEVDKNGDGEVGRV